MGGRRGGAAVPRRPDAETFEEVARAPGFVLGVAVDGRGRLAVCASADGSLCGYDGESVRRLVTGLTQANYPAFAADGTLYVSASGGVGRGRRVDRARSRPTARRRR